MPVLAAPRAVRVLCGGVLVLGALVAGPAATASRPAADPPCEFENVERVVAVGDVHGAYDRFVAILRAASVVDARGRWAGGKTHLVQTGDVLDRGSDSRKVLDLLQQLGRDAPKSGGRVHALIGNHEAMRLIGDDRYIAPGEYAAFRNVDSEELRKLVVESLAPEVRARVLSETPLGRIEMLRAFGPEGAYGKFLRGLNAVVRINGVLFMHGGISPSVAPLTCTEINARIRKELSADLENTKKAPEATLVTREDGPLWYRGLATEPESFAPRLDEILTAQHASAIVVGHTVRPDGRIQVRFGGKVLVIDTGMQPGYVPTGAASALEIRGGQFTAIYTDRKDVIGSVPSMAR